MKLTFQFLSFLSVVAAASALSCACVSPNPSLSNALYSKTYAVKVLIQKEIVNPNPMDPFLPWRPSYFEAKVQNIFKQGDPEVLAKAEQIVVMGGMCNYLPEENTPYIIITDYLAHVADVPGYDGGEVKVLSMPGFCEFHSKWDDLPDERVQQLRRYKNKGTTPCFDDDCDSEMVAFPIPLCLDNTVPKHTEVCEYNPGTNLCQKDLKVEDCPPVP